MTCDTQVCGPSNSVTVLVVLGGIVATFGAGPWLIGLLNYPGSIRVSSVHTLKLQQLEIRHHSSIQALGFGSPKLFSWISAFFSSQP